MAHISYPGYMSFILHVILSSFAFSGSLLYALLVNFLMKAGGCWWVKKENLYRPLSISHPVIQLNVIQSACTPLRLKAEG